MTSKHRFEVVPYSALPDVREIAALADANPVVLAADLAALPDGIHGMAARVAGRVRASCLVVDRELPDGKRSLVRLHAAGEEPATAALALVDWGEADGRTRGARELKVSIARAPGLAEELKSRGYALVESYVIMRRAGPARPAGPLPPGVRELALEEAGDALYLSTGNEAFAGVPGAFPFTLDDWERVKTAPAFRASLVKVLADSGGPLGFIRGAWAPDYPGEVEAIGLLPRARGRGLGRWVLRRCEELLTREGATEIHLMVAASNERAAELYMKEGYVETSRRNTYRRTL